MHNSPRVFIKRGVGQEGKRASVQAGKMSSGQDDKPGHSGQVAISGHGREDPLWWFVLVLVIVGLTARPSPIFYMFEYKLVKNCSSGSTQVVEWLRVRTCEMFE